MSSQKLTLIRGVPGSGKTTLAEGIDAYLVEADQFFLDATGNYKYDPKRIRDAHRWFQREVSRLLSLGLNVVVANTFIKLWEMEFYLELASDYGVDVEIIVAKGKYRNIHGAEESLMI